MNEDTTRLHMEKTVQQSLEDALDGSRVAPEYTTGSLAQRTSVPSDTLRSWERRYGFPTPSRTETNRRLYSERDIAAVTWLREQTERGRGIGEAIRLLRSYLNASPSATLEGATATVDTPLEVADPPLQMLADALLDGDLASARTIWDEVVITLSPDAIGNAVTLPLRARLLHGLDEPDTATKLDRALAFLLRKATVLLDHADPDTGERSVCLLTSGSPDSALAGTVLASTLARSGFRIITPFLDAGAIETLGAIQNFRPDIVITIPGAHSTPGTLARLLTDQRLYTWSPDSTAASFPSADLLPPAPADAAAVLHRQASS